MRLFIGLTVPEEIQQTLKQAWHGASVNPVGLATKRSSLWHVTLAFLDDVPEEHLETLRHLVEAAAAHPPGGAFVMNHFETFPRRKPSRVVVPTIPENLKTWSTCVESLRDMISILAPKIDRKPWQPHISITRNEKGKYLEPWSEPIPAIFWTPRSVAIIKSTPGATGSMYETLCEFPCDIAQTRHHGFVAG
jgi:2'-5' RNA ligase